MSTSYSSLRLSTLVSLFWMVSCAQSPPSLPPHLPSALTLKSSTDAHLLGPGDLIEVRVYLEPELSGLYRVGPKGTFSFPLIGEVVATNFGLVELTQELSVRLSKEYLRNPQVTVILKESHSKKVFVLGMVYKPGSYKFEPAMRVVQAIALAGGLKTLASKDLVLIRAAKGGQEQKFRIPFKEISQGQAQNSLLRPGDIIYVPESWY